ncbi:MAG TPA: ASKHA domain-containing protein, partial [Longimicrobiales bacterium]
DVRQLQLVKGSIAAATAMLLDSAGLALDDIGEFLVAGAFGNYIRKSSAQLVGLLPDIDPERVRFVGHSAGVGARMLLLDARARERAARVAATAEFIDLAGRADYEDRFMDALRFPEMAMAAV